MKNIATTDNWRIIDRIIDVEATHRSPRFHHYTLNENAKDFWLKLPRFDMSLGGDSLTKGLREYNEWISKFISTKECINLLFDVEIEKIELSSQPCCASLGSNSNWIKSAAIRAGYGVDEFVQMKLKSIAEAEIKIFQQEFILQRI